MKSRSKKARKKQQQSRLQIEELEERIAPGLLTVTPPTDVAQHKLAEPPAHAMHGLNTAEAHTGGVINWTPGA